jgi:hypothetical protein
MTAVFRIVIFIDDAPREDLASSKLARLAQALKIAVF